MRLSIIIPTLDEAERAVMALGALQDMRARGADLVVADGGSRDLTVPLALPLCDALVHAPADRAARMNAGSDCARGDVFLFLPPEMRLPPDADLLISSALGRTRRLWGSICGVTGASGLRARLEALYARLFGLAWHDQALFVRRSAFEAVNGFAEGEAQDIARLSRRLRRAGRPAVVYPEATTCIRRSGAPPRLAPLRA